jgi:hypothetical protein
MAAPLTRVEFGSWVEVELIDQTGEAELMACTIVSALAADLSRSLLGEDTPLARAIVGQPVGSVVACGMGDIRSVRIVSARPASPQPTADAAARRAAILQTARAAAERTNAEMFAASFSGKWGDYDAEGMAVEDSLREE